MLLLLLSLIVVVAVVDALLVGSVVGVVVAAVVVTVVVAVVVADVVAVVVAIGDFSIFHQLRFDTKVYSLVAITMGVLSYRNGLPLSFRTTLAPLFGKAIWGWLGDLVDIFTILTIVAGLCTSLALGAQQIVAGAGQ